MARRAAKLDAGAAANGSKDGAAAVCDSGNQSTSTKWQKNSRKIAEK